MTPHAKRPITIVALVAALALFIQPSRPFIGQMPVFAQTGSHYAASSTRAPAPQAPVDGGWPRTYNLANGGKAVVSQPQVASWDRQTHLVAFSAVAFISNPAETKPAMG